ncbi:liprin-beta-2 isoform X2 [Tachysurus fulvidraco]|uniref:liprin-beta-2 isoform X2 n=1 Tax=Tachysurus fulvidraco TaxID=1234273 RepID=UPI001FEF2A39|nr:liprin-beta-2 isoform X2 [Tachysurus fulvidraco]
MLKSASEQMDGITAEQIRLEGTGIRWTPLGREEFTLTYNSLSEDFVHETYRDVISDPGSETIVTADEINRVPALLGSPTDHCMPLRALQLDEDIVRRQNPTTRERTVLLWLDKSLDNLRALGNNESYQERLCRLEGDKESLVLQVSVLTDQVAAQGEKIRDLENSLEEHQLKLNSTEEMLQQELLSRTAFESQKLNLMDEVSSLNLKLVNMEERQSPSTERQHKAESVVNLISELQEQMCRIQQELSCKIQEKKAAESQEDEDSETDASSVESAEETSAEDQSSGDLGAEELCSCRRESSLLQELRLLKNKVEELEDEKSQYERKLKASKAEISSLQHLLQCRNAEIENLQAQLLSRSPISIDNSEREELYRRRLNTKHQELLKLKAGMELLIAANDEKDRRIEELSLLLTHCRQLRDGKALLQQTSAPQCSSEEEEQSTALRAKPLTLKAHSEMMSGASSPLLPSKSPEQKETDMRSQPRNTSGSQEDLKSEELKPVMGSPAEPASSDEPKPVNGKCVLIEGNKSDGSESRSQEGSQDGDMSQGKAERPEESSACDASPSSSGVDSGEHSPVSQENLKNNKSIRKLWGKIKRTQSGALGTGDDLEPTEFRRGGFRATAGPRLARTPDSGRSVRDMTVPFSNWTTEQVCGWLEDFGLGQYVSLARQWVMSGQTLLSATPQEFEKEMAIKHPLHRKKLQLALRSFNNKAMEKSSELDHIWVTRWLDDIGLPQYKDQFHESRVDGRVLQYLTVNDLLFLKVTSQLHHLSIKCAIHVLHANKFNPHCLRRRPGDENKTSPSEVVQWSNHRVMEWLRSVDLAEYAPNLRGSGVHGGLIILEPRFTSETLAMLLNIPPQKTLLRRHLTTNFSSLVGAQAQQEKREYSNASGHTPLTTTAKVRPKKLGFTNFSHLRKRRPDESADYICPVEMGNSPILNGTTHQL